MVDFIARQLDLAPTAIQDYGRRIHTRTDYLLNVRAYLGFRKAMAGDLEDLTHWLLQLPQYGSKPATSTIHDTTYLLDGILNNETVLPILEHTTDTAGFTDVIFALFDLLSLRFSPRLRDTEFTYARYLVTATAKYFPASINTPNRVVRQQTGNLFSSACLF